MSKVMGIYVKFYHDHAPNMVLSRNPGSKFRKIFSSDSILNFRKRFQIWGKLAQEQKCYRQKNPVLIGLSTLNHT